MFFICCHPKRSPENRDTSNGIAFAWSIMFIAESNLVSLSVQVGGAHGNASDLGNLWLTFHFFIYFLWKCFAAVFKL